MKKDNVEALKSSVLVGIAYGLLTGGIFLLIGNPHFLWFGLCSSAAGFLLGLLTTWYPDGE